MPGLLPSQRNWLERLIFQLEFNPYQLIHLVGGPGSGKTTLTLAVAELLSSEFNLALIKAEAEFTALQIRQHMLEHWFGVCKDANKPLLQLVGDRQLQEPLAVVIDQAELLPAELWAELADLPCLVIAATEQPDAHAELNLPIPALTLADAQQLLGDDGLNTLTVADRLDKAHGNLHLLLDPSLKLSVSRQPAELKQASLAYPLAVFSAGMLLIGAVVLFWFWTERQPEGLGQLTYLPEEQLVVTAPELTPQPAASKAVVEQLVGNLEQVGSKTASSSATGLAKPVDFSGEEAVLSQAENLSNSDNSSNSEPQLGSTQVALANGADGTDESSVALPTEQSTKPLAKPLTKQPADISAAELAAQELAAQELAKVPQLSQGAATTPAITVPAAEEDSVAAQMTQELAQETTLTQQAVASTVDLAKEAEAELSTAKPQPRKAVSAGGYQYAESELLAMSGQGVALQLVVFSNDTALNAFKQQYKALEFYTYQRNKNGQRQLVVVQGPFADAAEAKAQISQLPAALRQAFVKPLADIHSEISVQ